MLSIAGSDSGGGAGIQADLKAFARCGVHGMTAITAITAQNTVAVTAVHPIPGEVIVEQVRAVVDDIGVDAVKIGMLGTRETIEAVGEALDLVGDAPVVLDPVMVAESGARLLDEDAQEALRTQLVPRAAVVTPNVPEARVLAASGGDAGGPADPLDAEELVRAVHALGPRAVVLTGGHREEAIDLFFDGERLVEIPGERYRERRGARVGLHALVGARRAPRARPRAARGRAGRQGDRLGGGPGRPSRPSGTAPGRSTCSGSRSAPAAARPGRPALRATPGRCPAGGPSTRRATARRRMSPGSSPISSRRKAR